MTSAWSRSSRWLVASHVFCSIVRVFSRSDGTSPSKHMLYRGPVSSSPTAHIRRAWMDLMIMVQKRRNPTMPLVFLTDANAHVKGTLREGIGNHFPANPSLPDTIFCQYGSRNWLGCTGNVRTHDCSHVARLSIQCARGAQAPLRHVTSATCLCVQAIIHVFPGYGS